MSPAGVVSIIVCAALAGSAFWAVVALAERLPHRLGLWLAFAVGLLAYDLLAAIAHRLVL